MANIGKPCSKPITALHPDSLSQSPAELYNELESDPPAVYVPPPEIAWDVIREANHQADLEASWKVAQVARSEADPEVVSSPFPPIARIPRGVTMLSTPVVYRRRGKRHSAHYEDIKAGLFIEPVSIGLRAKATPDHEVDTLIAASIAGKSEDEIRALVIKLREARKGAL